MVPMLTGTHVGENTDPTSSVLSWQLHTSREGFVLTRSGTTLLTRKWPCKDLADTVSHNGNSGTVANVPETESCCQASRPIRP